jgi:hypothetical protein
VLTKLRAPLDEANERTPLSRLVQSKFELLTLYNTMRILLDNIKSGWYHEYYKFVPNASSIRDFLRIGKDV